MVYRKRNIKRGGRKPKTGVVSRVGNALSVALKCARDIYRIKGMINCEKKWATNSYAAQTFDYNGYVGSITNVAEGDDAFQRNGYSVLGRTINLNLDVFASGVSTGSTVRVCVVIDKLCTGTIPNGADLLQYAGSVNVINGQRVTATLPRFTMLFDRVISISNDGKDTQHIRHNINFRHHVKYTGNAATDEYTGQCWLMIFSNESTNLPYFNGVIRFGYYDN